MITSTDTSTLARLLRDGSLRAVYQPIVELATGEVVAFEALLRGPEGTPMESPGALFAAAVSEGLTEELEDAAVDLALDGALASGLGRDVAIFVNIEGEQVARLRSQLAEGRHADALRRLRVVVEVTERNLLARPGELLLLGEELRRAGWGLAIDDVGAEHAEGVAALPFVQPDVVKLDIELIQERPAMSAATAEIALAVRQHVEDFGTAVVAEGIEHEGHVVRARTLGADLGQGWLFARPGPLPAPTGRSASHPRLTIRQEASVENRLPSQIVGAHQRLTTATKGDLLAISRAFETRALSEAPHVAVFGLMQEADNYTPRTRWRYESLAEVGALVAIFGAGMDGLVTDRVRTVDVGADDPLRDEWSVIIWGAGHRGALVAHDLGDTDVPDMERRFAFAITHDAGLVIDVGRSLLSHLPLRTR